MTATEIALDGKTYLVERTEDRTRVGVVVCPCTAQHPYIRWLRPDGPRAAKALEAANAAR